MKKTSCAIVFLCVLLLGSCTAPTQDPELPTDDCAQITNPTTEEKSDVTQLSTEENTLETIDTEVYPNTVYAHLSSEDVDTHINSLDIELPFNLVSGLFIAEAVEYSMITETNKADKAFSVADMDYSLPYDHSLLSSVSHAPSYDVYTDESERISCKVAHDGTLLQFYNSNLYRGSSQTGISDENARLIADAFIAENYPSIDIGAYTVTVQTSPGDSIQTTFTMIVYHRVFHEYTINESIMIVINSDGKISSVTTDNLGVCDRYGIITDTRIAELREQLINSIICVGHHPINFKECVMLGSDGNLYMYMLANGWTFNEQGMIDENSQEITVTYYVRLDP